MVNNKAYKVARFAIMFATIFVAMMIDRAVSLVGLPFSMAAFTILITLSFCFLDNNWLTAIVAGLFFGVASFVKEFIFPSPTVGAIFQPQYWPLITIPPRLLMGIAAFGAYRLVLCYTNNMTAKKQQSISIAVAALVGCIVNTLGFLSMVELCKTMCNMEAKGVFVVIYGILVTNIIPEYLIACICCPLVVLGVRRGLKLGVDGNGARRASQQNGEIV